MKYSAFQVEVVFLKVTDYASDAIYCGNGREWYSKKRVGEENG